MLRLKEQYRHLRGVSHGTHTVAEMILEPPRNALHNLIQIRKVNGKTFSIATFLASKMKSILYFFSDEANLWNLFELLLDPRPMFNSASDQMVWDRCTEWQQPRRRTKWYASSRHLFFHKRQVQATAKFVPC